MVVHRDAGSRLVECWVGVDIESIVMLTARSVDQQKE
jgi:hypothetical protein